MRATIQSVSCLAILVTLCALARAENWTRFRGPNGQGIASEVELPVTWSATDNVAWKVSIPGNGWSSPIVCEQHVFLTTAMHEGTTP